MALDDLRRRIRALDQQLVDTVAQRIEAAREAGRAKRDQHQAIRDYDVEKEVVARIRDGFADRGLDPALGEQLARLLIAEALRVQEHDGLQPATGGHGRALVVGGAGKMGQWFAHFLNGLGFQVAIHDPAGPVEGFPSADDPDAHARDCELVVLATPPSVTEPLLERFAPSGALVFDIASLKSPFQEALTGLARDHPVTSIHPLWGPAARVLSGKNVVVLDCGNEEAAERARALLLQTAATVVSLPLHLHDRLMAYTLTLPHALNLVYADVLASSGQAYSELELLGGPTFTKQNSVTREVASEDPDLYREIQALNDETPRIYDALGRALEGLEERVQSDGAFREAMLTYRTYLGTYEGGFP